MTTTSPRSERRPLPLLLAAPPRRTCGDCRECCTALPVVSIGKPDKCSCVHLTAAGCGRQAVKPADCAGWLCDWLAGALPEPYRPDKCGLIFDIKPSLVPAEPGWWCLIHECRPGALAHADRVRYLRGVVEKRYRPVVRTLVYPHGVGTAFPGEVAADYPGRAAAATQVTRYGFDRQAGWWRAEEVAEADAPVAA